MQSKGLSRIFSNTTVEKHQFFTVEERNRFKGLDLTDRVPDELWTEVRDRKQGSRPFPWKEMQKSKMAVWEGLTNSCGKKISEKDRRKGKI